MKIITRVTQPDVEPLSLTDAKEHLREYLDESVHDDVIVAFISAAREHAEIYCGRSWAPATFAMRLDEFPCGAIELPPDVTAITSISYTASNGDTTTVPSNTYTLDAELREVYPTSGWPTGSRVRVLFTAGPDEVPPTVLSAMKLTLGDLFANREASIVGVSRTDNPARDNLLHFHRVGMGL